MPLFWWNVSLKDRITFFNVNLAKSLLVGALLGGFYWFVFKKGGGSLGFNFDIFGVALVTAVVEELTFSGFILGYLSKNTKFSKNLLLVLVGGLVVLSRLPILFFDFHLPLSQVFFVSLIVFGTSVLNGFVRVWSGNVAGSIVARLLLNLATLI